MLGNSLSTAFHFFKVPMTEMLNQNYFDAILFIGKDYRQYDV